MTLNFQTLNSHSPSHAGYPSTVNHCGNAKIPLPRNAVALALSICILEEAACAADPFRLLSWNVESNRPNQEPVSDAINDW